jgi:cytochrome P450
MTSQPLYRPPAPNPGQPIRGLLRAIMRFERDLLGLMPREAYQKLVSPLGRSRRSILLVNAPDVVTTVLVDSNGIFPKNDLMVGALEPLVGDSIFVSSGPTWRRQRRMVEPAFSHMRINKAFDFMAAAVDDYARVLDRRAATGEAFSLDAAMSHLTADVICRTIFSKSLESRAARDIFDAFTVFEASVANVEIRRLLFGRPFEKIPQPARVLAACGQIRHHIGAMLDERMAAGGSQPDDIAGAVIAARDADTGAAFTREELIDQIGVFFLAGHETSASVLTWAFFILSQQPETVARMREEIARVAGEGPIEMEHTKRLTFVRNVFRETLRLYPPITFIPRVALENTEIAGHAVKKGAMIMISPWAIHRHEALYRNPDRFDPDRFVPEREREIAQGAYMPFGVGPRLCVGAAFATIEACLILARLVRRYDFEVLDAHKVRPVARLTTRPARQILCRVRRR